MVPPVTQTDFSTKTIFIYKYLNHHFYISFIIEKALKTTYGISIKHFPTYLYNLKANFS